MRKTIYIVLAALGLCLFAGCGSSDKEKVSPLVKQLAGEWQLKTWNGEAPRDFDAYVSFGADRSFEIYQRIEQVGYQKYSGKYEIRNGMLGGVYSDGKPFGSTYDITFDESGNTLTLTSATGVAETGVYVRAAIPDGVKKRSGRDEEFPDGSDPAFIEHRRRDRSPLAPCAASLDAAHFLCTFHPVSGSGFSPQASRKGYTLVTFLPVRLFSIS